MDSRRLMIPLQIGPDGMLVRTDEISADRAMARLISGLEKGICPMDREMGVPSRLGSSEEEIRQNVEAALKRDFKRYLPGVRVWIAEVGRQGAGYKVRVGFARAGRAIGDEEGFAWDYVPGLE